MIYFVGIDKLYIHRDLLAFNAENQTMANMKFKGFVIVFHCLCWVATVTTILYWVYIFSLDGDLSNVDNRPFYERKQDIFPVLSLCFRNPFSDEKLEKTGTGVNATSYLKFLKGEHFLSEMMEIDYKNITMDISEYIEDATVGWRNGTSAMYSESPSLININKIFVTTSSGIWLHQMFYKCYGMQLPREKRIEYFSVLLNYKVFQNTNERGLFNFFTLLHYPNQLLRSMRSIKLSWPKGKPNATLDMRFMINAMEVIRRRNKRNRPCNEGWRNHDSAILTSHFDKIGCTAPYQYSNNTVRKCTTLDEMRKARFTLRSDEYGTLPPCTSMDKIIYSYEEDDVSSTSWKRSGCVWIGLYLFDDHYKEIIHTRYNIYQLSI